jgi:dinuclear metal center YbgI/SA1388 family protein
MPAKYVIYHFITFAVMNALINDIIQVLENWAPPALQESYDNSGLICGDAQLACSGVVVCLDSTEAVIDEAIEKGYNLVVAHHPILFSGIKKLSGKTYAERAIIKAIRNNIAIYALHTNLDAVYTGVNKKIGALLGIDKPSILRKAEQHLLQLVTYVPEDSAEKVRIALFAAGAGAIGNYDECSFNLSGIGTFRPGPDSDPVLGKHGIRESVSEQRIEVILPVWKRQAVLDALWKAHPYEEVAYQYFKTENTLQDAGSGMIGLLPEAIHVDDFFRKVKSTFGGIIRYTKPNKKLVQKIAWCGGSGSFLLQDAIRNGADVFLTSDFKYHQFFDAEERILIADIGHFENEQFTIELIYTHLKDNFPNFAGCQTGIQTNPIHYF